MRGPGTVGVACLLVVFCLAMASNACAFKIGTHQLVNRRGADASRLDGYLRRELGLAGGLAERFNEREVRQWIELGGAAEDNFLHSEILGGVFRARHHFHNPLEPWDRAGLSGRCVLVPVVGEASVRWAQERDQGLSGRASWGDARRAFLEALTLPSRGDRDSAWARGFQILGQQLHLIADLASPAHVRNDPHCLGDGFEAWVSRPANASLIQRLITDQLKKPDPAIFTLGVPIGDEIATVPVARLWDTDQYDAASPNPDITLSPTIGLAEYANANFLSGDTAFSGFPFPAQTSVGLLVERDLKTGEDRPYFKKLRDGETDYRLAVPTTLFNFLPDRLKIRRIGLDDTVFRDYATKLLPRAVGYSAALLDYFFRGTLDVDLVEDSADSSRFQLIGTNGVNSDELVAGTLTLYADDPMGARGEVAGVRSIPVRGVQQRQDLFSLPPTFVPPENAERFVVVYKGTVGFEKQEGAFPGGVVGKVLGGVRVEQVFADGKRWKLRTPQNVFLLPLTVAEFEDVRWGDGDNTLVARAAFTPERPIRVVAYEVQRLPNSIELKTVDTPGGPEVQLTKTSEAGFPFSMPAVTTVQFSQTVRYRQQLVRYTPTLVSQWNPLLHEYDALPTEYSPYQIETVHQQAVPFARNFAVTLDVAHNDSFGTETGPYVWSLQEVAADASGRLLGLVVVTLTSLTIPEVKLPSFNVDAAGGLTVAEEISIFPTFPPGMDTLLWALVDFTEGRLVASTADPTITIVSQTRYEGPPWGSVPGFNTGGIGRHDLVRLEGGGPSDGLFDFGWYATFPPFRQRAVNGPPAEVTEFQSEEGFVEISVGGLPGGEVKDELARLGLVGFQLSTGTGDPIEVDVNCSGIGLETCRTLWLVPSAGAVIQSPVGLQDARRSRPAPAPGTERLVLTTEDGRILVWNPGTSARAVLDQPGLRFVGPATRSTLMVFDLSGATLEPSTLLVPLESTRPPIVFPGQFLSGFTLLDPSYLYSVQELKFFRSKPPLLRTALPAKLADLPGGRNPRGDYHAIPVP